MAIPAISFPPIPEKLPPMVEAALAGMRRDRRTRLLQGLYLLGASGLSVERELRAVMEMGLGLSDDNVSVKRVFSKDLPAGKLAIRETPYFIRCSRLALLRLSELGFQACKELGWTVLPSEWQQLIRSHAGLLYPRHTLGLLAFCWQARLRGWKTTLLPVVDASLEPDALISKSNVHMYVEFEIRSHRKQNKWKKIYKFQGFVAICSFTRTTRIGLVNDCKDIRVDGIATDLQTLIQSVTNHRTKQLWIESWKC